MVRKESVSFDEIKKGFMSDDRERARHGKKADFKVKKIEEAFTKFGNECLCQNDIFDLPRV